MADEPAPTTGTDAIAALDAFLAGVMQRATIPGLGLAVMQDGQMRINAAFGHASLELGVPATPATVFPIASVTKAFTAVLVMQAVEAGRLALDDHLGELVEGQRGGAPGDLPAPLPADWQAVTVRQMLSHVSGLPDVIADPMSVSWLAEARGPALEAAAALPMQFEPGTEWSYNQTNYVLLGALVERLSGQPFGALLAETILAPLGLTATRFGDARELVTGRGPWYSRLDLTGPEPRLAESIHPTWVTYPVFAQPCAGLNTTALELATFVDAVAGGRLLDPGTVATMWQPMRLRDGRPAGPDPSSAVGLGWIVEELAGRTLVGASGGGSVAFRHAVADRLTVAVLTNCQGANPDGIATAVVARLLGLDPAG
jgi:CubicO group peptidase (beta-lactamase class C family)